MRSIKDVIPNVLRELQDPKKLAKSRLISQWPAIAGPKLAPHTRPSLGREGRLYVWTDEASLAYELSQRYRASILKRVQAVIGEELVKSVHVRVGQLKPL